MTVTERGHAVTTVSIAQTLETAAEHVRAGWTQHQPFDEDEVNGKIYVCASGAIWLAAGLSVCLEECDLQILRDDMPSYQLWEEVTRCLGEYVEDFVPSWNDAIGQTQDRVADTLLRLAKELRNNESP